MSIIPPIRSPLRVAHIVLQLETGGMEKLLVEFARHADRSRFDLRFVSMTGRGTLSEEIEACGWPVMALNESPGLRPAMILRLARLMRELSLDVVHTHNSKPLLYAGAAARLARVPVILNTCHGQRYRSSLPHTMMFVLASRSVHRMVCVSQNSADRREREGIPLRKIRTIRNGIDISRFSYYGPRSDGPAVLVTRLRPEKDVETLLRAAALLVQRHPSFGLDIAGDGECSPALRQMAIDLKLTQNVRFLGNVDDIAALLARARLFVMSSLAEGIPVGLLEAMACGLPAVVTQVGGNPEVVRHGETGLLVPPADPAQLAAAIEQVWADAELGHRLGLAARKRIEQHFDVREMVGRYEALYEELACDRHEQPRQSLAGSTV